MTHAINRPAQAAQPKIYSFLNDVRVNQPLLMMATLKLLVVILEPNILVTLV